MSNWCENHQPQRHKFPPSLMLLSFKTRIKWRSVLTATASFSSVFFQLRSHSRYYPSFSAHRAALMTKTTLILPAFSLRFVNFIVQFCFRCKFSFHEKLLIQFKLTVSWFSWTNLNSLLCIATSEIASFCIDNRLRQWLFSCSPKWAKAGFRVKMKDF